MYIKRILEYQIDQYIDSPEIIAIIGPRQCGKTTLIRHIASSLESVEIISFEDITILQMFENDISTFVKIYVHNKKFLFIDEFQYAKEGGKKLKYIFDSQKIKIFISGSSAIDLTVHAVKYLVGRILVFNLYQFNFEEFLEYKDPHLVPVLKKQRELFTLNKPLNMEHTTHPTLAHFYEEYSLYGGYPRVVLTDQVDKKIEIIKNIYNTYFLREVRDVLGLIDDHKLDKLIKGFAVQVGGMINYHDIGVLSEFSYKLLKKYINFLEKTFIFSFIKPYYINKTVEIVKNPKIYFYDNGLRNVILNDFRKLADREDRGELLENSVYGELIKNSKIVKYWRTKKKQEIDFIVEDRDKKLVAIEVKTNYEKCSTENLDIFAKKYKNARKILLYFRKDAVAEGHPDTIRYPIYILAK